MSSKKQIFKISSLKKLLTDENSCVTLIPTTRLLALPPFFLNDMKSGILYLLNNMLKKYDRSLGGIVIGYQNVKVLMDENTGIIPMGTPETEVNVSLELYVFQPKIGSLLEGVVNKKSNSHVGCLVHRYFNATILKPEDVDHEKWICKDFNVDDKITFKVKDLDFTSVLPLIEGIVDDRKLFDNVKSNSSESCSMSNEIAKSVNKVYSKEDSFFEDSSGKERERKKIAEVIAQKEHVKECFIECDSFINLRKEKNKKEEKGDKELLNISDMCNQVEKKEGIGDKALTSDTLSIVNVNEKYSLKKKKKKKKKDKQKQKDEDVKNTQGISKSLQNIERCLYSREAEDEIFSSTQLNLDGVEKMKICCSPISKSALVEEGSHKQNEINGMKMEQKHKKRKTEEEDPLEPKKLKFSHSSFSEKESTKDRIKSDKDKSSVQAITEELCIKELDRIKKEFNAPSKRSEVSLINCKAQRKKKEKLNKKEKEILNLNKSKKVPENGISESEQTSEIHSLLDELRKQEIQRVREELNISGRESCEETNKTKVTVKEKKNRTSEEKIDENLFSLNKNAKTELNDTGDCKKKSSVQSIMDQFLKQEFGKVNEEYKKSDLKNINEGKKARKVINKNEETSLGKTDNLQYEKLIKEKKRAVNSEKKAKKTQKKDLSSLKSSSKIRGVVEKSDSNLKEIAFYSETSEKYKNGSMYDTELSPEKINFEKSLFSDSEQSCRSPGKIEKEVNGSGINSVERIIFPTEYVSAGRKERTTKSGQEQEFLYEKLLREAKSLIQNKNECSPRKKRKTYSSSNKKLNEKHL